DYWREHRPTEWLFVGRTRTGYVCIETVRKVFRKAVVAAGITKKITPHMESGVNILVIQALLGHRSIRTTKVYTHMSLAHIGRVKSPLDLLGTKANPFG
ncbi:MAG: tyrosine-type recombinase/integrase, partial [Gammaproteobacteria bacterium]|nr:tyrosine-type recombinase/integrase [Gammaproteobacteria bacterium]